ncbi:MAG TPA: MASE3 domain-containing protein [Candidatus Acidoferrum sp.]|nr:MASE3 domain-containing protein [Candidatus Acidoferrum sp.]
MVWSIVLTLLMGVMLMNQDVALFASVADYLSLHNLFELLSIGVAMMVFLLVSSLPKSRLDWHIVMLGCGFLAVGLGDLGHTMAYPGMSNFFSTKTSVAIFFRLYARYVLASMLFALFLPVGRSSITMYRWLLAAALALCALGLWLGMQQPAWLAPFYAPASGTASLKSFTEYLLILLYVVSSLLLARRVTQTGDQRDALLAAAAWAMVLSEVFFTYYTQLTGLYNLAGHIYKLAAYYLVYQALFTAGVTAPYLELAHQRSWAQSLLESLPDPVWLKDADGRYLSSNNAFKDICGLDPADLVGKTDYDLFSRELADSFRRYDQRALAGTGTMSNEELVDTFTKGKRLYLTSKIAVRLPSGVLLGVLGIANDITDRTRMEAQLRQSQKMEAVGQLTAGIAHDFNNILAVVLGNLELLTGSLTGPREQQFAQHAYDAGMRGASLTQSLLSYARRQSLAPSNIDVAGLLVNEARMLERSLEESVSIDLEIEGGLWSVHADASRLQDAILNLALNARDAMPKGGKLTLTARNVTLDADSALLDDGLKPGRYVRLQVKDTGNGIPADQLERVLEPFFTTKPEGAGSGLGLPMVYGFVRQTGGHFGIESAVGVGTCVTLLLPAAADSEARREPDAVSSELPGARAGETVLVVEDNEEVRQLVLNWLQGLGYRTIEAVDGPSALAQLQRGSRIDLLLTDVVLPNGMHGPDIAQAAQQQMPGIKALYMSGYAHNSLSEQSGIPLGVHLLQKPFRRQTLAQKVREVLDR